MANWNYLKFNKRCGDPCKKNVTPEPDSFVWGFDLRDHKIKICYQDRVGYSLVISEPGFLNDDCNIVAWAPIEEGKTEPNLAEIKKCGIYWPPTGSVEYQRKLIRVLSHKQPRSKFEKRANDASIAHAQAVLSDARKANSAST